MNKQEFQRRLDEVETLIADGKYSEAVAECDLLNLDLLDQPRVLQNIAKAYERCRRYADAEDLLLLAREFAPKSRGILFHLCSVSIKAGELQEAHRYYDEFEKRAKYDTQRFVLQYRIARAENRPETDLIKILDAYRREEPDDRWMFELARLQAKNGLLEESRMTCEDIDLWFNSGKYVNMARELLAQLSGEVYVPKAEEASVSDDTEEVPKTAEEVVPEEKGEPSPEEKDIPLYTAEEKPAETVRETVKPSFPFGRGTASEEEILSQETREIPTMNIQQSEELPPIEYDFSDIGDIIDDVQAEKKEQSRQESDEALPAADADTEESGFDAEKDALEYGDTRVIPTEEEKKQPSARESVIAMLREREARMAEENGRRRIVFAGDTATDNIEAVISETSEKNTETAPEASMEQGDAAREEASVDVTDEENPEALEAPEFSPEGDEHVVFRVEREERPMVSPDTGMLPIMEEEDDREIANPIFIDFPDEVVTPKEEIAEAEEEPAAGLLPAAEETEQPKEEPVFDAHVSFDDEDEEKEADRNSFRDSAKARIDSLVSDFDQPMEEQDDVEFIVSEIARRKQDEQLFGNLPIDPPVDEHIWHFIVFGETNPLALDCAREHMKEISETIPNCPGRMLKINSDRIGNANIVNSIDRFLGSMVVVEQAASLSDQQLRDFAKILDRDDRSLLVVFTDTKDDIIEMFRRVPELSESFTAVFEGKILNARDLVNTAKEYLYSQGAKFAKEADPVVYEKARELLGAKQGYYKSDMREYAEKALGQAEKSGFLGLSGGKVDRDGYLVVTEKHLRKADRS